MGCVKHTEGPAAPRAQVKVDPKVATPTEIMRARAKAIGPGTHRRSPREIDWLQSQTKPKPLAPAQDLHRIHPMTADL